MSNIFSTLIPTHEKVYFFSISKSKSSISILFTNDKILLPSTTSFQKNYCSLQTTSNSFDIHEKNRAQFVLFWYCFQKTRQMTTVFLSYYCSNLMSNNSVRKLTSNAVNSQKKLCPDVMVQKTQHHVSTQWLQVQARLQPSCKVRLIVWHFF